MKEIAGIWLPDGETHMVPFLEDERHWVDGKGTYQFRKLEAVLGYVDRWRCAVDVGAHVGTWTTHLAKRFQRVVAFEPVEQHRQCFRRNVPTGGAELHGVVLGRENGSAVMETMADSTGSARVKAAKGGDEPWVHGEWRAVGDNIPVLRLDQYGLTDLDFIKLDCEGYELFALQGAEETLRRCRPVVIVEQKPGRAQCHGLTERQAVDYLQDLGAVLRRELSGDFIFSWD